MAYAIKDITTSPCTSVQGIVIAFLLLQVFGLAPALGLLPIALFATLIGTLFNSQGAINPNSAIRGASVVVMLGVEGLFDPKGLYQ